MSHVTNNMTNVYEKRGLLNGKMTEGKRVICFSLWGNEPKNCVGAVENAKLARELFPDWFCRFYVSPSVPELIVETLKDIPNTEVIVVRSHGDSPLSDLWKYFVFEDKNVQVAIFRSVSSRLSKRDVVAVEDWLRGAFSVHIIRDHPKNNPQPIPPDSWGAVCPEFRWLSAEVRTYIDGFFPDTQERIVMGRTRTEPTEKDVVDFLSRRVYMNYVSKSFVHDSFPHYNPWSGRNFEQGKIKEFNTGLPVARNAYEDHSNKWDDFIGQKYDANNVPDKELANELQEVEESLSALYSSHMEKQDVWV